VGQSILDFRFWIGKSLEMVELALAGKERKFFPYPMGGLKPIFFG
jgi:hypothetical protein